MYALQESMQQMRGTAAAQIVGVRVSLAHGAGNMFSAAHTIIFTNDG